MAKKKPKKKAKKKQRDYKYNSKFNRMLLPPLLNPFKKDKVRKKPNVVTKHKINKLIKDRRNVLRKMAPIALKDVATYPKRKLKAKVTGRIRYFDPRNVSVCHRRKIRREELFKKGLVGKGISVSKIRVRDITSKVYCKRR